MLYQKRCLIQYLLLKILGLFEFKLFKLPNGLGGFIVKAHHIISDAITFAITANTIAEIYYKLLSNEQLEQKNFSYIDYIQSEKEYLASEKFKKDKDYWDEVLTPLPEAGFIPSKENVLINSYKANRIEYVLEDNYFKDIKAFCEKHRISMYNFLIAIYSIYIGHISNLQNFTLGTPVLNRSSAKEKNTSGMFINTSLLNIHLQDDLSFTDFCKNISKTCMGMLRHQKYNYQYILKDIRQKNNTINKLYDIMLSYQTAKVSDSKSAVSYTPKWYGNEYISDSLDIHFHDNSNSGKLTIEYDYQIDKYTADNIDTIHNRILHIIKQVSKNENITLSDIEIITSKERNQILNKFNTNKFNYPRDKTIIELFQEQVQKNPNKTALVFSDIKISYKKLDRLSDILASKLLKFNIEPDDKIAIFLDKSIKMIVCILAILKVNACYVPIDIKYPKNRTKYILKDSNAKLVLTAKRLNNSSFNDIDTLFIDDVNFKTKSNFEYKKPSIPSLAYVMYTSGSTGNPKGVMIEQKSIVRLVKNPNYIEFRENERILQTASIVFDACTFEIWAALLNGFELYVFTKGHLLNPKHLSTYIKENNITILWLTAALFNHLSDIDPYMFKNVHYLLTGGDVLSPKHINKVMEANPKLKIINGYGPTENTTFTCCFNIDKQYSSSIPIGYPISGTSCYVVSSNGKLQPVGIPGELWTGGDGVGRGYLSHADLTAEKFIANPFGDGMVYKTGDLVEWLPDGSINFLGRIDNQVKIRGYRVELNEINNTILMYEHVKNSATIVKTINGEKTICSYIVPKDSLKLEDLKSYLLELLPNYMIPSYFTIMNSLPITINGKVDREKLPLPELHEENKVVVMPTSDIENEIYVAVNEIKPNKKLSINDDFFKDIGFDSLDAMQLCAKLYDHNISIQDINNFPTIKLLADKIVKKVNVSLFKNVLPEINVKDKTTVFDLSTVLLTGALGFLGMHLLQELLQDNRVNTIYCLVRGKDNVDYKERFYNTLNYYFGDNLNDLVKQKVMLLSGDFRSETLNLSETDYNELTKVLTSVIHCGAIVKHYGDFDKFNDANVKGTKNIIKLCEASNAKLAHISTISVGGFSSTDDKHYLTEENFNIDQSFNNQVYMITKYLAEYYVLEAINAGKIDGKIFRLGNIMPRISDNTFQYNSKDNAMFSRLHTIIDLKCMPKSYENLPLDFSPVDLCAKSIVKLIGLNDEQTIYHIYNNNQTTVKDFLKLSGIDCKVVSNQEMSNLIKDSADPFSAHILNDLQSSNFVETPANNEITTHILNSNNFYWNKIDENYANNLTDLLNKLN